MEKGRSGLPECGKTAGTCLNCGERVSCVRADISLKIKKAVNSASIYGRCRHLFGRLGRTDNSVNGQDASISW